MKHYFTLFLLFSLNGLLAQSHSSCDGIRYRTNVFSEVEVTQGLQFGSGTTIGGDFQELFMDIYEPVGDAANQRPAVVLAFGGSYITGDREDLDWLCEAYTQRGFVAVTIDYRLYDLSIIPLPTAEEMQDVVTRSISDMKAAIRYLREDAATDNLYRIDPNLIFVGGISAGAITAAHTAVLDSTDVFSPELLELIQTNGGFEGNSSDNLEYSSEVQGFVNFSGGLNDASWIDAGDPPFVSMHDENDGTVPYGSGNASVFGIPIIFMDGSLVLKQVADSVGVVNELRTIENSNGHVSYFGSNASTNSTLNFTAEFLHDIICSGVVSSIDHPVDDLPDVKVFPNPTTGLIQITSAEHQSFHFSLYNALGQPLGTWENTTEIDLSGFSSGIYFL